MADTPAEIVSGATEIPEGEPSSTDTQTEGTEQPQPEQEATDWRKRQKEDSTLNAHIQSELSKARTRWQRQQLREHAKTATETNNAEYQRYVAQQVAAEAEEADDGEAHDADWIKAADRVQPQLERVLQLDADGRATNPYYVQLHQKIGRTEMDKRYADDPVAFVNWVDDQIMEMRVDEKVKKVSPGLAAAMAQDEAHTRLRNQPAPLGGSGASSGALTPDAYSAMSFAERQKLRKENPRAIDEMIARAQR